MATIAKRIRWLVWSDIRSTLEENLIFKEVGVDESKGQWLIRKVAGQPLAPIGLPASIFDFTNNTFYKTVIPDTASFKYYIGRTRAEIETAIIRGAIKVNTLCIATDELKSFITVPFSNGASGLYLQEILTGSGVNGVISWAGITGKPTTLAGYGITDAIAISQIGIPGGVPNLGSDTKIPAIYLPTDVTDVRLSYGAINDISSAISTNIANNKRAIGILNDTIGARLVYRYDATTLKEFITRWTNVKETPTTLSGYGIIDAINISEKGAPNGVATLDSNGKLNLDQIPTTLQIGEVFQISNPSEFNTIPTANLNPGDFCYVVSTQKLYIYTNDYIWQELSLGTIYWGSILNKPTTLIGYGITDAINISEKGAPNGIAPLDSQSKIPLANLPSGLPIDFADVLNKPNTLAGYGITDAINISEKGVPDGVATLDNSGKVTPSQLNVSFNSLTGKPTTLAGYGITDGLSASQKGASDGIAPLDSQSKIPPIYINNNSPILWSAIANKPNTLAGFGITDGLPLGQKGAPNGVAPLGADSRIPTQYLPSSTQRLDVAWKAGGSNSHLGNTACLAELYKYNLIILHGFFRVLLPLATPGDWFDASIYFYGDNAVQGNFVELYSQNTPVRFFREDPLRFGAGDHYYIENNHTTGGIGWNNRGHVNFRAYFFDAGVGWMFMFF